MLILSAVVGILAGLGAVIIKNGVRFIHELLIQNFSAEDENYWYIIFPTIGILLTLLFIKLVIHQRVGHGIPTVLFAISRDKGVIKQHNIFSSIITSILTVGFGGSVGLEGPTVATGSAIGSNLGRLFHLNHKQILHLLGVACAGAMAAIFKSPIAAIVFATEVIMIDLTMASVVPLLIASSTAVLTSYAFMGQHTLYPFEVTEGFKMSQVHFYVILGIFGGIVSAYFTKTYIFIASIFSAINSWQKRLVLGGLVLGGLIFFFPALFGEGYDAVNSALKGDFSALYTNSIFYGLKDNMMVIFLLFILIVLLKAVATSVTFGAGGIGGIFAPTLFMGAFTGLFYVTLINHFGIAQLNESNFALMGMGALIAGVLHGPLTAIFLIAEITGGYELFVPLMITATISYATVKIFVPNSVYTYQLAKRGELFTHHKDKAVLAMMKVTKLIERNFRTIGPDDTLGDLTKLIAESQRNLFPVVSKENKFVGLIRLDDIRQIIFKPELYDTTYVRSIMITPEVTIDPDESMEAVAKKFQDSGKYNIAVIKDGHYLGFVSRAKVFSKYRSLLRYFSDD